MSQTILAACALMVASLLVLNQGRADAYARRDMVDQELEVMAAGVALQVLEYIGLQQFDAAEDDGPIASTSSLVPASNFSGTSGNYPNGRRCDVTPPVASSSPYHACTHLEDFNRMQWENVPFLAGGDTLEFQASARVAYVNADQTASNTRTFHKRVTVLVRALPPDARDTLFRPISLDRVFSYPR